MSIFPPFLNYLYGKLRCYLHIPFYSMNNGEFLFMLS